jgi:hypothetical protein
MWFVTPLFLTMNLVCAGVGYLVGDVLRRNLTHREAGRANLPTAYEAARYIPWRRFLFVLPFLGAFWGLITGGAGGVLCFGFGITIGAIFAMPVGVLGMSAFGVSHRLLQRDGMIELSQLLPVTLGIATAITAFILGAPIGQLR